MTHTRVEQAVLARLQEHEAEMVETTRQLVRIPSVVGQEAKAQAYVKNLFSRERLRTVEFEPDFSKISQHPAYCGWKEESSAYVGRPNIIGFWDGDPKAKSLILNGHIDTVSPEPVSQWRHDPFGAEIVDGKMYGRGANDMKSGIVAALFAIRAIREAGFKPTGSVQLQSVIEEEAGGGGGTLACLIEGYTADAFVAVEPTRNCVRIANAGILYFRVSCEGSTAHAGNAHLGVNAISKMSKITDALFALDEKRGREVRYPLFEKGSFGRACNLSLGTIRGGDWPSTVCGWASVEGRLSFVPGESMQEVKQNVEHTIAQVAESDAWLREHRPKVEWFGWRCEPWEEHPDQPFVKMLQRAALDATGEQAEITGRASGVDSRFPHLFGFPGVCYGTSGGQNHGVDEYTEVGKLLGCARALALLTLRWCGVEKS